VREIPDDPAEADRQRRLRRRIGRLAQEARAPWLLPLLPLFAPLLLGWIGLMIAAPAQLRRITAPILQRLLPPIPTRQTLDPDPADELPPPAAADPPTPRLTVPDRSDRPRIKVTRTPMSFAPVPAN
jgi:hypothetical protein